MAWFWDLYTQFDFLHELPCQVFQSYPHSCPIQTQHHISPQEHLLLGRALLRWEGVGVGYNFCLGVKVKCKKRHLEREGESLKQQNSHSSSSGDKFMLGLWRAAWASNQPPLQCSQQGLPTFPWAHEAPCQAKWLSHHFLQMLTRERSVVTQPAASSMSTLPRKKQLCLLGFLGNVWSVYTTCPGSGEMSMHRETVPLFQAESLQNTKWAYKLDLLSLEACMARWDGKPVYFGDMKEAEGKEQTYRMW